MKIDLPSIKSRTYVAPSFRGDDSLPVDPELQRRLKRPMVVGAWVVGVFVLGALLLAAVAPIESAVVAPGTVRVEAYRKLIRHREGGIVRAIPVREGQRVRPGQLLIQMDDVQPRASVDVLTNQQDAILAQLTRFQAEASGARQLAFPPLIATRMNDPKVAALVHDQEFLFTSRLGVFEGQQQVMGQRIEQIQTQMTGVQAQLDALAESDRLTKEELAGYQTLYEKGYAPKTLILRLQRTLADLAGRRGQLIAEMNRLREQMGEARIQLSTQREERISQAAEGARQMQAALAEVTPKLAAAQQVLAGAFVRSPADGYVLGLSQHTVGGVVSPGEHLMEIIPADTPLLVTARIKPHDVDSVKLGMKARVTLSAFDYRKVSPVGAEVVGISADQLVDEKTGEGYFRADLQIVPQDLAKLPKGLKLSPGMPAEAMIVTGKRTILSYVVSPLTDTLKGALRED